MVIYCFHNRTVFNFITLLGNCNNSINILKCIPHSVVSKKHNYWGNVLEMQDKQFLCVSIKKSSIDLVTGIKDSAKGIYTL